MAPSIRIPSGTAAPASAGGAVGLIGIDPRRRLRRSSRLMAGVPMWMHPNIRGRLILLILLAVNVALLLVPANPHHRRRAWRSC
jgi:hypothetical protein